MSEWSYLDTLGVLAVAVATVSLARAVEGVAQVLIVGVGVALVVLWLGYFVLLGYNERS